MTYEPKPTDYAEPAKPWDFTHGIVNPFDTHTSLDLDKSPLSHDLEPTDAESLVASLHPEELTPTQLCDKANQLLDTYGETTIVNGVPAIVTRKFWRVDQAHGGFYARLGKPAHTEDGKIVLPSFILTNDAEFSNIVTPNEKFSELFFDYDEAHGTQLLNGPDAPTPTGYRSNRSGHLKLAYEIIQDIAAQYRQDAIITPVPPHRPNNPTPAPSITPVEFTSTDHRLQYKRSAIAAVLAIAVAGGVTAVETTGSSQDTTTQSGIQNPAAPPEATICNPDGVCAPAPSSPLDSLPLAPLADINQLPVNPTYRIALDKIAYPGTETLNPAHIAETKPGTYRYGYPAETVAVSGDGQCTFIEGNFNQGISSILTTSTTLGRLIRIKVIDTSTLEVCKTSDAPANTPGAFYIVRGTA